MTFEAGETMKPSELRLRKRHPRVSIVGIFGELFVTAGLLVLLFLGWQLWLNDIIVGGQQSATANKISEGWSRGEGTGAVKPTDPGEPAVMTAPGNAQTFAVMIVPRWGASYERPIAEGIGVSDVLNKIGLGHYPGTQMPGEIGNFAVASHRMAHGGGFKDLHQLQIGDHIYVETQDGWYRYVFRSLQYVHPSEVGVIAPVPEHPDAVPVERMITLTTCNPFFSTAERLIAYGVYDTWYPRAGGPPAEIAGTVSARSN